MSEKDNLFIREYLPHRYPFLLIDKIVEITPMESIVALKNVTANEPFFNGHFPQRPIMPGVLMIEALAQASGLLTYQSLDSKPNFEKELYTLEELFREHVLGFLVAKGKLDPVFAQKLRAWRHSGFGVHNGKVIAKDDRAGLERVAQYIARNSFSESKMTYNEETGVVL